MSLTFKLFRDERIAAITAISITIFVGTSDTISDILVFFSYLSQGLVGLAIAVALCDYMPGTVILGHHIRSDIWRNTAMIHKLLAVLMLIFHPFSLMVTNILWLFNISSEHFHHMARVSTVLHGTVEAPVQFILLLYAFSKGFLPLPWVTAVILMDRNNNIIPLGKIGLFSLDAQENTIPRQGISIHSNLDQIV